MTDDKKELSNSLNDRLEIAKTYKDYPEYVWFTNLGIATLRKTLDLRGLPRKFIKVEFTKTSVPKLYYPSEHSQTIIVQLPSELKDESKNKERDQALLFYASIIPNNEYMIGEKLGIVAKMLGVKQSESSLKKNLSKIHKNFSRSKS